MDTRVIKKFATYVGVIVGSSLAVTLLNLGLEELTGMSLLGSVVVFVGLALYGIYQFAQSKVNYERLMEQQLIDKMSRGSNEPTW
jgi:hypothetical protein